MIEDERSHVIETLADLKKSDTEKISKAASGALWNLRDELRNSNDKTHQEIGRHRYRNKINAAHTIAIIIYYDDPFI